MDRDEQGGAGIARHVHALAERDESVVGTCHQHAVFAGFLDPLTQAPGEIEHDILLHDVPARPFGSGVDAAVTGVEHHQRPLVGGVGRRFAALRRFGTGRFGVERDFAQKTLAIGRRQIEHEAGRRIHGGVDDKSLLDAGGLGQIEHHARAAGHHQAEAKRLDQPAAALAGLGGN